MWKEQDKDCEVKLASNYDNDEEEKEEERKGDDFIGNYITSIEQNSWKVMRQKLRNEKAKCKK